MASCAVCTPAFCRAILTTSWSVVVVGDSHITANALKSCLEAWLSSKLHHEISLSGACAYTSKGSTPGILEVHQVVASFGEINSGPMRIVVLSTSKIGTPSGDVGDLESLL